jgi:heat-inducible transcriptional repressor
LLEVDSRLTPSDLQKASNYLTYHLHGRTLAQAKESIAQDISQQRAQLDNLTCSLIEQGLALPVQNDGLLIIRGQAHLLNDIRGSAELDQIKRLFETLEQRETLFKLMEQTESANGVQIFIGSQNTLFDHTGCAMIVAPYHNKTNQLIGAIGVIGPTRMDYGRIIPMIDYTSKLLGQILSGATG